MTRTLAENAAPLETPRARPGWRGRRACSAARLRFTLLYTETRVAAVKWYCTSRRVKTANASPRG
eukprot:2997600-Prymnesium_polylepis.1